MRTLSFVYAFGFVVVTSVVGVRGADMTETKVDGQTVEQIFQNPKVSALADAACAGDVPTVERELENGADPNGKGARGITPLFWAMKCKSVRGVKALLKAGADPNYRLPGRGGNTAVTIAAGMKDPTVLKLLLEYHGDPNRGATDSPSTALQVAMERGIGGGEWDNYYMLLDAGADINRRHAGTTIVEDAAALRQFSKVEELLKRGYSGGGNYGGREGWDGWTQLGALVQGDGEIDAKVFPEEAAARARVIEILKQKGVRFPVPMLRMIHFSGEVRMSDDETLIVNWFGGYSGKTVVAPSKQTIKHGEPSYDVILNLVHGLKPNEDKVIPRRPSDPSPYPS